MGVPPTSKWPISLLQVNLHSLFGHFDDGETVVKMTDCPANHDTCQHLCLFDDKMVFRNDAGILASCGCPGKCGSAEAMLEKIG